MVHIYGTPWITNYGENASDLWWVALQGLTWEDLQRGIEKCIATPSQYPVNLPTFKLYCQAEPALPVNPVLPKPWANRELTGRFLRKCHDILAGKKTSE